MESVIAIYLIWNKEYENDLLKIQGYGAEDIWLTVINEFSILMSLSRMKTLKHTSHHPADIQFAHYGNEEEVSRGNINIFHKWKTRRMWMKQHLTQS